MTSNSIEQAKKNGRGRPKLDIDYTLVDKLAHIHCTEAEIAEVLGVSTRTLQRNCEFCRIYKKGIEGAKVSLRRLQWETAEGIAPELVLDSFKQPQTDLKGNPIFKPGIPPNPTMQIWLGKQYLEQSDKRQTELTGKEGEPLYPKTMQLFLADGTQIKLPRNGHEAEEVKVGGDGH